ncbi:hypothetical protein ACJ6WF_21015 [Streptomyces sp. MMS24-I2-30]|uniref:hypothetical protein n=1 Tax=Streptomyces sp. MMS24-I2-30 TaxID=3351564 RepID=UPI003896CF10
MTTHDDENGRRPWSKAPTPTENLRLLTWRSVSDKRCYLSTADEANSTVTRVADNIEAAPISWEDRPLTPMKDLFDRLLPGTGRRRLPAFSRYREVTAPWR